MIIVRTKKGDHFVNDKAVIKVEHNKERATVTCYADKGIYSYMENVEQVVYTSDAQPVEWKDEGSEIQRLKTELEKKKRSTVSYMSISVMYANYIWLMSLLLYQSKNNRSRRSARIKVST